MEYYIDPFSLCMCSPTFLHVWLKPQRLKLQSTKPMSPSRRPINADGIDTENRTQGTEKVFNINVLDCHISKSIQSICQLSNVFLGVNSSLFRNHFQLQFSLGMLRAFSVSR